MRPDLSQDQLHQIMTAVSEMRGDKADPSSSSGAGNTSPPPTDEELRDFLDYMGQGVVSMDTMELDQNTRQKEHGEENEGSEDQMSIKRDKSTAQYIYRQHYLSIIQEEEEKDSENNTPSHSRPNSRPVSLHGGFNPLAIKPELLKKAIKEYKTHKADSQKHELSTESLRLSNPVSPTEASSGSTSTADAKEEPTVKTIAADPAVLSKYICSEPSVLPSSDLTSNLHSGEADKTSSETVPSFFYPVKQVSSLKEIANSNDPGSNGSTISNSMVTLADSRCTSSSSSNDPAKELPMDVVVVPDLLVNTTAVSSMTAIPRSDEPSSNPVLPAKPKTLIRSNSALVFQGPFSSMKEKIKNVIGAKTETPNKQSEVVLPSAHQYKQGRKSSITSAQASPEYQPPSTVRRFFRSLSRKSSVEEQEQQAASESSRGHKKMTAETREGRRGNSRLLGRAVVEAAHKDELDRQGTGDTASGSVVVKVCDSSYISEPSTYSVVLLNLF